MGNISWAKFPLRQIMALRLRKDKSGAVATEYAFLIAFIAIVAAIGMTLLGLNLSAFFNDIGVALTNISGNLPQPFST
jgi:Flp pilus assembly pilin Flp